MDSDPTFWKTNKEEVIHEFAMPLIALKESGEAFASGTAFVIGRGWGLTAYHVFEDFLLRYEGKVCEGPDLGVSFGLQAFLTIDKGQRQLPVKVTRVWRNKPLDLLVLALEMSEHGPPNYVWKTPSLSLLPPCRGTPIAAFGFPDSRIDHPPGQLPELRLKPRTATGQVIEIHHELRDTARLPFPCFRTNARFDGGMSGGPVFNNDTGEICGVICSSLPATRDNEDHVTYASSLWPVVATAIDARLPSSSNTQPYRVIQLFQSRICHASDIDKVRVAADPSDSPRVWAAAIYNRALWDHT